MPNNGHCIVPHCQKTRIQHLFLSLMSLVGGVRKTPQYTLHGAVPSVLFNKLTRPEITRRRRTTTTAYQSDPTDINAASNNKKRQLEIIMHKESGDIRLDCKLVDNRRLVSK